MEDVRRLPVGEDREVAVSLDALAREGASHDRGGAVLEEETSGSSAAAICLRKVSLRSFRPKTLTHTRRSRRSLLNSTRPEPPTSTPMIASYTLIAT